MDINEVKDLIREVLQSDISEFELEHTGTRVRLKRGLSHESNASPSGPSPALSIAYPHTSAPEPMMPADTTPEDSEKNNLHIVTSPIVGTFYRAPSPGTEPYVQIGDPVQEGTVLCIVEAMKLMNEIPSDVAGEVVHIYVEDGHPVEFGQRLFGISPRK